MCQSYSKPKVGRFLRHSVQEKCPFLPKQNRTKFVSVCYVVFGKRENVLCLISFFRMKVLHIPQGPKTGYDSSAAALCD